MLNRKKFKSFPESQQSPSRTSGTFTVNRQAQVIMFRPRRPKSWNDDNIKEWTGQSMSSLLRIVDDSGRWAVIAADAPQWRLDVTGILVS